MLFEESKMVEEVRPNIGRAKLRLPAEDMDYGWSLFNLARSNFYD